ncbi:hypothetical protein CPB86DRAFT_871728 [Serendipita vermifera]|nr:hypothetical protein CPB86DRAFT_871728 [Serendipita vermifera]
MASRTPVELWNKILKYAISVPLFFDPNPAETCGIDNFRNYYQEYTYWESERIRHSLRTVCKPWNSFLRRFNHRYVRLVDILHERIPNSALALAIRLNLEPDPLCTCSKFCRDHVKIVGQSVVFNSVGDKLVECFKKAVTSIDNTYGITRTWNLEILDGQLTREGDEFLFLKGKAPLLAAIVRKAGCNLSTLGSLSESLLTLTTDGVWGLSELTTTDVLRLSNLTTLSLCLVSMNFPIQELALPSLKHLSIEYGDDLESQDPETSLMKILEILGQNLETMYFHAGCRFRPVPEELWSLCPRLIRIQIPYQWTEMPPNAHPLRIFRIMMDEWDATSTPQGILSFLPTPSNLALNNALPSSFLVRLNQPWSKILFRSYNPTLRATFVIYDYYSSYGIVLEDYQGISLHFFIIYVLVNYWRRPFREKKKSSSAFLTTGIHDSREVKT